LVQARVAKRRAGAIAELKAKAEARGEVFNLEDHMAKTKEANRLHALKVQEENRVAAEKRDAENKAFAEKRAAENKAYAEKRDAEIKAFNEKRDAQIKAREAETEKRDAEVKAYTEKRDAQIKADKERRALSAAAAPSAATSDAVGLQCFVVCSLVSRCTI
jgi:colicin import membrane protein